MPTIRIDEDVYSWLKSQAVPFEDTPNTILRKLAGLDKKASLIHNDSTSHDNQYKKGGPNTMAFVKTKGGQLSGKYLAHLWKVDVVHALYHKDGTWYNHLREFPGALFDPSGYVIFNTEREYMNSTYLNHGQELNVHGGISSIPGYKRMQ